MDFRENFLVFWLSEVHLRFLMHSIQLWLNDYFNSYLLSVSLTIDFKRNWTLKTFSPAHCLSSVQFNHSVISDSLRPHGPQHARPPYPSPTPGVYPNSCPLSRWCHPTISSFVVPFSSCLQSSPASRSFQMSQFFASGGQNIGVAASTSVLPNSGLISVKIDWLDFLQSKGLSRVFSNTTVQKHQFFGAQLSLQSHSHMHTWLLEKP